MHGKSNDGGFANIAIKPKKYMDVMSHFITVAIHQSVEVCKDKPNRREHTWNIGYYKHSVVDGNNLKIIDEGTLWNKSDLWCVVDVALKQAHCVHIVGPQMGTTLTLTDFWGEVEANNYFLVSDEWRLRGLKQSPKESQLRGILCIEDPPIIIHCWKGLSRRKLVILDLANYVPLPVEDLISDFGLGEPLPLDESLTTLRKTEALGQRCDAVSKAVESLLGIVIKHKCKSIRSTIAGCAYDVFLRGFHDGSVHYHNSQEARELERHAVYGGICEVLQHGSIEGELTILDVNSLYPYVMAIEPMPVKLIGMGESIKLPDVPAALNGRGIIAECLIETDGYTFPKRTTNGVCHYRGSYWTVLPTPEFLAAWDMGLIKQVGRHCLYEMGKPFEGFVHEMYMCRREAARVGNKSKAVMLKLLMNGLAGRFAKKDNRWIDAPEEEAFKPWGVWARVRAGETLPNYYRSVNWNVQKLNAPCEGQESIPAIYAHITSAARCHVRYLIDVAEECNVYYVDTDSLHVGREGRKNLEICGYIDQEAIGRLKVEETGYFAHYYGIKDYNFDGKVVVGGMSSYCEDRYSRNPDVWVYPRLQSVLHYRPTGIITGEKVKMNLNPCHVKGTIDETGRVIPYTANEDYADFRQLLSRSATMSHGRSATKYRGSSRKES